MKQEPKEFNSFKEFYPFYLSEHKNIKNRRMHFAGSWLVLLTIGFTIGANHPGLVYLIPVFGYGFAWLGHFIYEKNQPATFQFPYYSFMGDWVMFKDILVGKVKIL